MIQTIAQEAAADAKKKYEDLFNDYTEAGCLESWRPFPTIDAIAIPMTSKIILGKADGNGMVCMCGMLYDLAVTSAKLLRFLVTGDVSVSDSDSSSDGDDIDRDSGIAGGHRTSIATHHRTQPLSRRWTLGLWRRHPTGKT